MPHIHRALISVSDKRGLAEFAKALSAMNVGIISTGGTSNVLKAAGIPFRTVSDVTGFPEILDGRVKTLHPKIHAGLLAVADNEEHTRQLEQLGVEPIDLVVVNLYPFEQTVAKAGVTLEEAIEQIDIGGPTMLRAAAKNFKHKAVVVNPDRYEALLAEMKAQHCVLSEKTCFELAKEVFRHTTVYDSVISGYLDAQGGGESPFPDVTHFAMQKDQVLRYGENPHQKAVLYGGFSRIFEKLHGKELSYNNIVDIAAAARLAADFEEPTVAIIKHTNPCGVGSASTVAEAYARAFATDTKSAFGGIVAANAPVDMAAAEMINEVFTEVIVAPAFETGVVEFLKKKKDRRLIKNNGDARSFGMMDIKSVPGGLLLQNADTERIQQGSLKIVTKRKPAQEELASMMFAWRVAKHVKSNAIVYALADRTIGIGAGQMSRVDSARLAAWKAAEMGLSVRDTAVASDAFFPFADGLLEAVHAGSTCVIQPGGSVRDEEVIAAADQHDIAMAFTGIRHFKH
ncbi:MAG: bifunctional phosphoribosylaminoimidazolecarboxamide formyltransferase/IMP cyclohydrolase [Bacteroidetes bacterium]|nr:bifunctional phosphoribosylaminoimidazolecarboxamide formyltransferase/IMP cyclohydrolase [Bacteroidota bacterium]MCW5895717.1 bifunctional phosphoribosylaminoimidazolecarboxamide formyltransferase/IMP cyclohydrolase [Bacteroidota bacterium]